MFKDVVKLIAGFCDFFLTSKFLIKLKVKLTHDVIVRTVDTVVKGPIALIGNVDKEVPIFVLVSKFCPFHHAHPECTVGPIPQVMRGFA